MTSNIQNTTSDKNIPKKVLVTGSAGFIGSALCLYLLARGDEVIGIDNHNDYYDPALKEARLAREANHPSLLLIFNFF
jgi:nucleoside-diphosphate-sugar epimerase